MRTFNPEKELNKIQKGNKNKIIIGVCLLLLIVAIGSSYSIYQIKYNKRIIYTTVDKFYSKDIQISVYVNGKEVEEFPAKSDNYSYSGYECENDSTVTFDHNDWTAQIKSTGPDKCKIKFGVKNINYDTLRIKEDILVDETNDANLRYIGANPANYIWFNCLKYDGLTNENAETDDYKCEKWRIIGLMNDMTIVDELTKKETDNQSLVKIIRIDKTGISVWNSENKNNWAEASLQKTLNVDYLNPNDDGTWITNSKDEKYKPISAKTLEFVENVKWNIGGWNGANITAQDYYKHERGITTYNSQPNIWNGKVALMYPSDFKYATDGSNSGTSREDCLIRISNTQECSDKDWLYIPGVPQWTIMPFSGNSSDAFYIWTVGTISTVYSHNGAAVRPTLYLKSNAKILDGEGTNEISYILILNNEA